MGTDISVFGPNAIEFHETCEREARCHLGERLFQAAFDEGAQHSVGETVDYALDIRRPGKDSAVEEILTRREREVAELVGHGLSNRQIAERLVLSTRTVDGHLEHILAKLGFGSRVQVAGWIAARIKPST
jgi:DNA-binding NarL/FixJ family response regulator